MHSAAATGMSQGELWIDFAHSDEADQWISVNDNVMGGVSSGALERGEDCAVFSGSTSLQYNGGFASVRRHLMPGELRACRALTVLVRGDGRQYQLRLRQQRGPSAIAWRQQFAGTPDWQALTLPLAGFEAVFRGRRVADAGVLDAAAVCDIGIMIADGQAGPFRLELRQILQHRA